MPNESLSTRKGGVLNPDEGIAYLTQAWEPVNRTV